MTSPDTENDQDQAPPKTSAVFPFYLTIGISMGVAIGLSIDNLALGIGLGIALGAGADAILYARAAKKNKV
jgi:hypothetical protein